MCEREYGRNEKRGQRRRERQMELGKEGKWGERCRERGDEREENGKEEYGKKKGKEGERKKLRDQRQK